MEIPINAGTSVGTDYADASVLSRLLTVGFVLIRGGMCGCLKKRQTEEKGSLWL